MKVKEAINMFTYHQRASLKARTLQSYRYILEKFEQFGEQEFDSIGPDEIYQFLENLTRNCSKSTRRLRYAQVKAFFNFIIEKGSLNMRNPCHAPLITKVFKTPKHAARKILEKETIEELIYNTKNPRDRLLLELQAKCGLRIGESLKLHVSDVSDRKLILREPKSGKESEVAFMPELVAKRMREYINQEKLSPEDRIFPICYSTARALIRKLGKRLNVSVAPHDLRRYSATYASRCGVPLEIISKIILRHSDLKTTQIYLGKVTDSEALHWIDLLHNR